MKQILTFFFALLALPLVAACGFTPLYASGDGTGSQITVELIDGRGGHALRKALVQELATGLPGVEGSARLTVVIEEDLRRLTLQADEAATRTDAIAEAQYVFVYQGNAISGDAEAQTSFLVPDAPFSDITAQVDANERAMSVLAQRLVADLRLQLAKVQ